MTPINLESKRIADELDRAMQEYQAHPGGPRGISQRALAALSGVPQPTMPQVDKDAPKRDTHVKCPDCRELVRRDARVCKHCGCRLVPQ